MLLDIAAARSANSAKKRLEWAIRSESARGRREMLSAYKSEPHVPIEPHEFDADADLLNCLNGTLHLPSFTLRPHNPKDLITKCCDAEYRPGARSDLFDRFMRDVTGGNAELADFLQLIAGIALGGRNRDERMYMFIGPTATGKSTFLEAVKAMMGSYACSMSAESLLRRGGSGINNDIARLAGRRLVTACETDEGHQLNEATIKRLTGGDKITARFLFAEYFEFWAAFLLWMSSNHPPKFRYNDDAMTRRVVRCPFIHTVPPDRRDPAVKAALIDAKVSGAAILAWAVEGLKNYYDHGLRIPAIVEDATAEYHQEQNPIAEFVAECCEVAEGARIAQGELFNAYLGYAERDKLTPREFNDALKHILHCDGPVTVRAGNGKPARGWRGIKLKATDAADFVTCNGL